MEIIDLRSDTVTKPSSKMLEYMNGAKVGDDVFEEDPTVIELETKVANMFGMEAALFCPSGTMTNQIAIKVLTQPLHEVICDKLSHVYNYEGGGIAFNSSASVRLINGKQGRFCSEDVLDNINPDNIHYPISSLVCIENTCNRGGGSCWDFTEIRKIEKTCKDNKLKLHLDGARIFNALAETKESALDYGKLFDTISICLSKGLGAPIGSLLIGNKEDIKSAKRLRKVLGGGMRQAGYIAAAGIYALDNNIERLTQDHEKASRIGEAISKLSFVSELMPVETNIVVFKLDDGYSSDEFIARLAKQNIKVVPFGKQTVRIVTHLDISNKMVDTLLMELLKM